MPEPLLQAVAISKAFSGVRALRDVSFDLFAGEVHAIVGENGAGKSTLIKIMTGAVAPDSGTLVVGGRSVPRMDPALSRSLGIAAIYQQPSLFPHLTVAENLAFALEGVARWRRVNWSARRKRAAELLDRVGAALHPDRLVETLSMPEQQLLEIAKAVGGAARVLIMDEPTASLSEREVDRLFRLVERLRSDGLGLIYISHRLEEVQAIAGRVTVLRDGESVATRSRDGLSRSDLIQLMTGRELSDIFPKKAVTPGDVALELRDVSCRAAGIRNVSIALRRGEILGLAGLVGSGRTELAGTMYGLTPADAGEVLLDGRRVDITSPARAIALGIDYVPEDRRRHGVVLEMAIPANVTLASLHLVSRAGFIDRDAEHATASRYVDALRVKAASLDDPVESLSGGNQQKVALARALAANPTVLILDEPTQGVDVGSKSEIHALMQSLVERGLAILMISSELPEILGMSDRIAVMRGGTIAGVLSRAEATQQSLLALALGHA
ncbi:MAG: sugar ABC transporter ATP-binding protein [Vicinamibacterales bacterium]|nr:sugar ABC transporter ATP-binding protein [Vicinamibacterales bacterium]